MSSLCTITSCTVEGWGGGGGGGGVEEEGWGRRMGKGAMKGSPVHIYDKLEQCTKACAIESKLLDVVVFELEQLYTGCLFHVRFPDKGCKTVAT